jgi:hypothetical protein
LQIFQLAEPQVCRYCRLSDCTAQASLAREQEALKLRERESDARLARIAETVRSQTRTLRAEFCGEDTAQVEAALEAAAEACHFNAALAELLNRARTEGAARDGPVGERSRVDVNGEKFLNFVVWPWPVDGVALHLGTSIVCEGNALDPRSCSRASILHRHACDDLMVVSVNR